MSIAFYEVQPDWTESDPTGWKVHIGYPLNVVGKYHDIKYLPDKEIVSFRFETIESDENIMPSADEMHKVTTEVLQTILKDVEEQHRKSIKE